MSVADVASGRLSIAMGPEEAVKYKVGFAAVATLLLLIVVLAPFVVTGVVMQILQPQAYRMYHLVAPGTRVANTHCRLHLAPIALDPWRGTLTLDVSGTHVCRPACPWSDRFFLVSLPQDGQQAEGLPPFQALTLPSTARAATQEITLPLAGQPIRYPFDSYQLRLGIIMERVWPDGSERVLSARGARGHLFVSLQAQIPGMTMDAPAARDPQRVGVPDSPYAYAAIALLTFRRPLYQPVLTVLLVLLIAAAAAYAVLMRPLHELVTSAGALILGVWGIRAILVGGSALPGTTALDLSLFVVIVFLLGAITVRMVHYLDRRSELHLFSRHRPELEPDDAAPS
jgi:hypothetical protein